MKILRHVFLIVALLFTSSGMGADTVTSVLELAVKLGPFLNLEATKLEVSRQIEKQKVAIEKELRAAPGTGELYDVPVYELNGQHWAVPVYVGGGKTPLAAGLDKAARKKAGETSISAAPPEGATLSNESSYLIWATLEGNTIKLNILKSVARELYFRRLEEELAKQK